jgi:hypothetical protein
MAAKEMTAERLRELVIYDPATGVFIRKVSSSPIARAGRVAGHCNRRHGHVFLSVDSKRFAAHRLAWLYVTGTWPKEKIDHINGDGLDNRFENLRDVSQKVNVQNRRKSHHNATSKYLGVCWNTSAKRWMAQIKTDGRNFNLGLHAEEEEAHAAYVAAKRQLHAGCTL